MSAAATSVGAAALPQTALAKDVGGKVRLDGFIYDARFVEAEEIAGHAGRQGVRLWAISNNLLDLWNDRLDVAWKKKPGAVAGVTTRGDLFFLETIAADRGMRVVYRGEHAAARDGAVTHSFEGPEALFEQAQFEATPELWAPLLGKAMVNCPPHGAKATTRSLATRAAPHDEREEALYSWVIAPRSRPTAA